MIKLDEYIGKKYNKLKVIKYDHIGQHKEKYYLFQCECGKQKVINLGNVKSGKTKSCGCNYKEILGNLYKKTNKYKKRNNYIIGYATNTQNKFYIDKEDYIKIKDISWYEANNGYICHKDTNKKVILLHRYIMDAPNNMVVDHINHKRNDNRKTNLKICTQQENAQNRLKKAKGITKIYRNKNVYYIVQLKGKYIGCFKEYNKALEIRRNYL